MPYSGDPSSSPADALRFALGDTGAVPILTDGEVSYLLANASGVVEAAALEGVEAILAKFAQDTDYTAGRVSRSLSQRVAGYEKLRAQLRAKRDALAFPIDTAQDRTADLTDAQNEALKQPFAVRGQFDNPEAPEPGVLPRSEDPQQ